MATYVSLRAAKVIEARLKTGGAGGQNAIHYIKLGMFSGGENFPSRRNLAKGTIIPYGEDMPRLITNQYGWKALRQKRQMLALSIADLARLSGLTEGMLTRLEMGTEQFTSDKIRSLARAFQITPEEFENDLLVISVQFQGTPSHITPEGLYPPEDMLIDEVVKATGSRLRQLRLERGWPLSKLAQLSGLSGRLIEGLENGDYELDENEFEKIAKAFEIPTGDLFNKLAGGNTDFRIRSSDESNFDPEARPQFLERRIDFPKEYKQAGIALLSEFANVLQNEFGEESVSVSIHQTGNVVRLRVERSDGNIKEIEKRLDDYGSVLRGELPVERFTKDKELIQELKTKFEVVALELRLTKEFHLKEVGDLRAQVVDLRHMVAAALTNQNSLAEIIKTMALKSSVSDNVLSKLTEIAALSTANHTKANEKMLRTLLADVQKEEPSFYQNMVDELASIPATVIGNLASPWVQTVLASLPRL